MGVVAIARDESHHASGPGGMTGAAHTRHPDP